MKRPFPPSLRQPSFAVDELDHGDGRGRYYYERTEYEGKAYRMDLCRDGAVTICEADQRPFNGAALPLLWSNDLAKLKAIQALTCVVAYEEEPRTVDRIDKGCRSIWSWGIRTGTLAQLHRIGDVAWLIHEDRVDEAIELAWEYDQQAYEDDPESMGTVYDQADQ